MRRVLYPAWTCCTAAKGACLEIVSSSKHNRLRQYCDALPEPLLPKALAAGLIAAGPSGMLPGRLEKLMAVSAPTITLVANEKGKPLKTLEVEGSVYYNFTHLLQY